MARPIGSKNKNSQSKKEAWELLEKHMTGEFTQKMITIMNKYYREHKYDEFIKIYNNLVKYFKPTLKAQDIQMDTNINIKITGSDNVIDKI